MTERPIGVACLGAGAWGRNQIRVFAGLPGCQLKYIVDLSSSALEQMRSLYPQAMPLPDLASAIADPAVAAVVIATSAPTHAAHARDALLAGKDVFIEKPMALDCADGEELVRLAEERGRIIQVGHLLLFHPAVAYLKDLVQRGELGTVHYAYTQRLNLGTIRSDESALWSLAPHDISLLNYLFDAEPVEVSARGGRFLQSEIEDVVFLSLQYPSGQLAHVHVSWLDPNKTRRVTLVGSRKMAVFDDMVTTEKLRIYDKGASRECYETFRESFDVRTGDILIPNIPVVEPLRAQAEHFLTCIRTRQRPMVSGEEGLAVVRIIQRADAELRSVKY